MTAAKSRGQQDYEEWRASLTDTPEKRAKYEDIAAKSDLWLQLVETRGAAGLAQEQLAHRLGVSQSQVARLETSEISRWEWADAGSLKADEAEAVLRELLNR